MLERLQGLKLTTETLGFVGLKSTTEVRRQILEEWVRLKKLDYALNWGWRMNNNVQPVILIIKGVNRIAVVVCLNDDFATNRQKG